MSNKKEAFAVRLSRDAYNMIMRQPASLKLEIGPNSSFMIINDRPFDLTVRKETSTVQVYEKDKKTKVEGGNRIRYVSDITHVAHVKQVLSEEDKKRVRSRTEEIQKEKDSRRIGLLDVPPSTTTNKTNNKKYMSPSHTLTTTNSIHTTTTTSTTASSPLSTSTATTKRNSLISPSLTPTNTNSSTLSPRISSPAPTSTPPTHLVPRLEGAALLNLRERLIHLLAIDPRPTDQLIQMLRVANNDLLPLLKKVAVNKNSNWCLRPEIFKEIRIWDWNRYDDKERAIVRKKAEEAYNYLNYPRNAPERNNLIQRKPHRGSPKLIPPPSQTPTTPNSSSLSSSASNNNNKQESNGTPNGYRNHHQPTTSSSLTPNSHHNHNNNTSSTTPNINKHSRSMDHHEESINPKLASSTKKRKIEKSTKSKPTKPTTTSIPISSSSTTKHSESKPSIKHTTTNNNNNHSTTNNHSSSASIHSHSPVTPTVTTKSTNHDGNYVKKSKIPSQVNSIDILTSSSNDDLSVDEEEIYTPPRIRTQMDFDTLCRAHQATQKDYIRFKKTFIKNHPIYIEGLSVIHEKDKTLFLRKLKSYYKARGGDMNKWRLLMKLSKQFNGTHTKINLMWDTIEKAYKKHKFSLRIKNHRQTSSSSSSSSHSSIASTSSSSSFLSKRAR